MGEENLEILWPFVLASIAGFSTMLGCLGIFIPVKKKDEFITFSISLSLSVMIMVSLFDLIPNSLPSLGTGFKAILMFCLFFFIGVMMVFILNRFIEREKGKSNNLYKLGILSFIALVLHNLPEGILTFMSTYHDFSLGLSLCLAITLHNIPEGISIAVPIYYSTGSVAKALKCTFLSALAEPLGALLAFIVLKNYITETMIGMFLILVAGIMITLSIEKMFPEAMGYNKKKYLILGVGVGVVIVLASLII
ncbi:MAG TPA: zinc transporter ZupT [Firmicutes bacterium]|nr:zinc transporter ZupT [Bacillota bacterium]